MRSIELNYVEADWGFCGVLIVIVIEIVIVIMIKIMIVKVMNIISGGEYIVRIPNEQSDIALGSFNAYLASS